MPRITFAPGISSSVATIESIITQLGFFATITGATPTLVTARSGPYTFSILGTGLTVGTISGEAALTGGTINGVVMRQNGALEVTISNLGLSAAAFQAAVAQENAGTDRAALETLFLGLDWHYVGNANADILPANAQSGDGVPLNLRGDDTFFGGGGNDNIFLGDGNDRGQGGAGNDQFFGSAGNDLLEGDTRGLSGDDRLYGGTGNDTLNGGAGHDTVAGGTGNDVLRDEGGADLFDGGLGIDTLLLDSRGLTTTVFNVHVNLTTGTHGAPEFSSDNDVLSGIENYTHRGNFNMTITASAVDNRLVTDAGIDLVIGLDGNDYISTGALADRLDGGRGNDTLLGGNGADLMTGGLGNDTLAGGAGFDTFVFGPASGRDTITDFALTEDRIDILPSVTATATQTAGGLLVNVGGVNTVLLQNLDLADFGQIIFI